MASDNGDSKKTKKLRAFKQKKLKPIKAPAMIKAGSSGKGAIPIQAQRKRKMPGLLG